MMHVRVTSFTVPYIDVSSDDNVYFNLSYVTGKFTNIKKFVFKKKSVNWSLRSE